MNSHRNGGYPKHSRRGLCDIYPYIQGVCINGMKWNTLFNNLRQHQNWQYFVDDIPGSNFTDFNIIGDKPLFEPMAV